MDKLAVVEYEINHLDSSPAPKPFKKHGYADLTEISWHQEYYSSDREDIKTLSRNHSQWIVVLSTGFLIGIAAIVIDFSSLWLYGLKSGICTSHLFFTKHQCPDNEWKSWSEFVFYFLKKGSYVHRLNNLIIYLASSVLAVLLASLIVQLVPFSGHSGIVELKAIISGLVMRGLLNFKVVIAKITGLVLVVSSGLWVGKEGPLVHISGAIAHCVASRFSLLKHNEALKRELFLASAAAGIAVAFNAPIGGVLFTLEQISCYFSLDRVMWKAFVCATISVTALQLFHPFKDAIRVQLFVVTDDNNWLLFEILPFLALGFVGGIAGVFFNILNIRLARWRKNTLSGSPNLQTAEMCILALVTAILSFANFTSQVPLHHVMYMLFTDCETKDRSADALEHAVHQMCELTKGKGFPIAALLKYTSSGVLGLFLTAYSYGTFIPGGVLMPSLVIGASMGRALGTVVQYLQNMYPHFKLFLNCNPEGMCISPGAYSIVGAASLFTGITRMTVTTVVILFEITGALTYVLPIMIGVMSAKMMNDVLLNQSCYDLWSKYHNLPLLKQDFEDLQKPILSVTECSKIAALAPIIHEEDCTVLMLLNLLEAECQYIPVVKSRDSPVLLGYVSSYSLAEELGNFQQTSGRCSFTASNEEVYSLQHLLCTQMMTLPATTPVSTAYNIFEKLRLSILFFNTPASPGELYGFITKQELLSCVEAS